MDLEKIAPPNLPLAPSTGVSVQFFEQFSNILRLFFTRLVKSYNALVGSQIRDGEGGAALYFPYAEFSYHNDQTAVADTRTQVLIDHVDHAAGISLAGNVITFDVPGFFIFFYNAVFVNSDVQPKTVRLWPRINGVDDPDTCMVSTIEPVAGGADGFKQLHFGTMHNFAEGDTLEFMWATEDADCHMHGEPAQVAPYVAPAGVSFSVTLTYVSNT